MIFRAGLAAVLAFPAISWAWDEEIGAAAPMLNGRLPSHTSIYRIDLALRGHDVTLTYHGQQADRHPQSLVLSSYSPPFGWQGVAADCPDLHFPELSVKVNGQRISSKPHATALFEGDDVTGELLKAGISPLRVTLTDDALIDPLSIRTKGAKKLFSKESSNPDLAYPLWQLMYSQAWKLPDSITGSFSIQVNYTARPAKREINTDSKVFSAAVLAHCGNPDQVKEMLKDKNGDVPAAIVIETMTVPLQLANMAPVDTFLVTSPADKARPGLRLASTLACGPEEASLFGSPYLKASKTVTNSVLSVLEIFVQS